MLGGLMTACPPEPSSHAPRASAAVSVAESQVRYSVGADVFEGTLLQPSGASVRGAMLFAPDWYGVYAYPLSEGRRFAELGFTVLVADLYGAGIRPKNDDEASRVTGDLRAHRSVLRARADRKSTRLNSSHVSE